MTQLEKSRYMKDKVTATINKFCETSGYADHCWVVGRAPGTVIRGVCMSVLKLLTISVNLTLHICHQEMLQKLLQHCKLVSCLPSCGN